MGTREQWLNDAVDILRPIYEPEATVPEVKVSIGFPPKKGVGKHRVLGVCFVADAASDRIHQIYINPTVAETGGGGWHSFNIDARTYTRLWYIQPRQGFP